MNKELEILSGRRIRRVAHLGDRITHATLMWCEKHQEPVWMYDDGSFSCQFDYIVEAQTEHKLVAGPWEDSEWN